HGAVFVRLAADHYQLDTADPSHWQLLRDVLGAHAPSHVVHLLALDAPSIEADDTLDRAQRLCCVSSLHLLQAIAAQGWSKPPRLTFVTRGAQAAAASSDVTQPSQALVWGFAGSAAQEYPELQIKLIDLGPTTSDEVDLLAQELLQVDGEPRIALRHGQRLAPRLQRSPRHTSGARERQIRADRTYLVSGGLGGLGLVVAERLVSLGARHVALLSRSAPSSDKLAALQALRDAGAQVHLVRADVAQRHELERALSTLRASAPPVDGVVHAAGVLDDATLANLRAAQVLPVLTPKVLGAALLTELLPELGFLVLFSSVTGVLGSAGQSAYAAANAYLDAFAHQRAARGHRVSSLAWGGWAEVGMAHARAQNLQGTGLIAPAEGAELFERLLDARAPQLTLVALDPRRLAAAPLLASHSLLRSLVQEQPQPQANDVGARARAAATPALRARVIEEYLLSAVGRVAGGAIPLSASTPLKELGLDSLMLLNLRSLIARELGVELGASTLLSLPSVEALTAHLVDTLSL
ncbi:MAG TPA: beta-ketoacyl reductase, partial [Polyangiales bacterium]